jgi:hypothetical protein
LNGPEAPDAAAPGATGGPAAPAPPPAVPTRADRWILTGFAVWTLLLLVGAWAQLTDNRAVLDWFDLHRWFTR